MSTFLVFAEVGPTGDVRNSAAGLLGLAAGLGTAVAVIAAKPGASEALVEQLGAFGAGEVVVGESDATGSLLGTPEADAVVAAIERLSPTAVLLPNSVLGREVAGRVAARLGSAVLADAVGVRLDGERPVAQHSVFGGAYTTESAVDGGLPIITVRDGAVAERAASVSATATPVPVQGDAPAAAIERVEVQTERSARPELRGAQVVVSGGRGLGSAERFDLVENLADVLGAAIGASRAAVDAGYVPQSYQVGQTGITVAPQLYIAVGISGAIQHRAGMQTAKTIVAINRDADAPIFEIADFGIVGDLFTVVPQLVDEIAARKR